MANNKAQRAKIAQVQFGAIVLIGLMLPDGLFAISVSQCAETFQLPKNHATKNIKDILGEESQLPKIASELNPNPVSYITLLQLEKLMFELALM